MGRVFVWNSRSRAGEYLNITLTMRACMQREDKQLWSDLLAIAIALDPRFNPVAPATTFRPPGAPTKDEFMDLSERATEELRKLRALRAHGGRAGHSDGRDDQCPVRCAFAA